MFDWLLWFTHMENSKPLALVLFFGAFCGILIYVFTGKKRAKRLESYKYMPFEEEESRQPELHGFARDTSGRGLKQTESRKVMDNE